MIRCILPLLALLVACPSVEPSPDDSRLDELPVDVEPDPEIAGICTLEADHPIWLDNDDEARRDEAIRGHFLPTTDDNSVPFLADDGAEYTLWADLDELALLLPELTDGTTLDWWPSVFSHESGADGWMAFTSVEGDLLLQVGYDRAEDVTVPLFAVGPDAGESACGAVPATSLEQWGCNEFVQKKPLRFTRGDSSFLLYEGQTAEVDGLLVTAHRSRRYSGQRAEDKCQQWAWEWTVRRAE